MSQQSPGGAPRYTVGQIVMTVLGVILLLPGLCSLLFIISMAGEIRMSDPIVQLIVGLWVICFLVSAGGVALLYAARKGARKSP
jgi:hypothetical protein